MKDSKENPDLVPAADETPPQDSVAQPEQPQKATMNKYNRIGLGIFLTFFVKNGITSKLDPTKRYSRAFMQGKRMDRRLFSNRRGAYGWEARQNIIRRGPLNRNWH